MMIAKSEVSLGIISVIHAPTKVVSSIKLNNPFMILKRISTATPTNSIKAKHPLSNLLPNAYTNNKYKIKRDPILNFFSITLSFIL